MERRADGGWRAGARVRALALAAVAIGLLAPAAEASHLSGRPGRAAGHVRGHVEVDARRRCARRPWRGTAPALDVQLVEVSRSKARLLISPLPKGTCFGAIGEALVGYTGGFQSFMHLQPNCPEGTLTMTAAHEFGHVLGLKHENRRLLADEQRVRVALPSAAARVGVVLLAAARRRPARPAAALRRQVPQGQPQLLRLDDAAGAVRSLGDAADPVDSLARVRSRSRRRRRRRCGG